MHSILHFFLLLLLALQIDISVGGIAGEDRSPKLENLKIKKVTIYDETESLHHEHSYDNEDIEATATGASPSSSNTTILSPSPSVSPTIAPSTLPPTTAPPTPSPSNRHEWWRNLGKFLLKTIFWMLVAGLFFFAFGAVMSNRYRIYYYLRDSWYSLLQKLKLSKRNSSDGSAPSSTLNDIIFSDNDLREGLLTRTQ